MKNAILSGVFLFQLLSPSLLLANAGGVGDIDETFRAYVKVERDQLQFANSLASTLSDTSGIQCYRQDTHLVATLLSTGAVANLFMHLKRLKEIPMDATQETLVAEYPHLEKLLNASLEYKIKRAEYSNPRLPREVLEKTLPGVIIYSQRAPDRGEKQSSFEFLANGVIKYTDEKGNISQGTWSIENVSLDMVRAAVKINVGQMEKLLALSSLPTEKSAGYFGSNSQMALAGYTVDPAATRKPIWNKEQIYMSLKYNCMLYAN